MKPVVFGIVMTALVSLGLVGWWFTQSPEAPSSKASAQVTPPPAAPVADKALHAVIRDLPPTGAVPEAPSTPAEPSALAPTAPPTAPPIVERPDELNQSDETAREAAADLGTAALQWLTPPEQVRKWVLLVDNVAMGKLPVKNRPFDVRLSPFQVSGAPDAPTLSERNHARLSPMVDAFVAVDPELLARYYQAWAPLLDQAYAELGQPGPFKTRLLEAIDRVLAVEPLPNRAVALKQPAVVFQYADPEREAASDLEKLLWRMGSQNTVRIQSQLREIKLALEQQS